MSLLTCDYHPSATQWAHDTARVAIMLQAALETVGKSTVEAVGHRMDATVPVDTGALSRNRTAVHAIGPLTWETGYTLPYAPILEYGGYHGVGPKTMALGGGDLGYDFVAGAGIYSRQAPLGWVRRSLSAEVKALRKRLATAVHTAWGGTARGATSAPLEGDAQTLSALFGVEII